MPSLSGGAGGTLVNGAAARDKVWTEYVDTVKDSLTESKEFMASMTPSQDTLMEELREDHKKMKLMMAQNIKLMSMLENNISGKREEDGSKSLGDGKLKKAEVHLQTL